jgi:hypothetical protein
VLITTIGWISCLTFAAQRHHGSHQVQQRPGKVVLSGQDHVVIHPDVIDGDTAGWAIPHGDTDGASGELLPWRAVAVPGMR